VNIKDLPSSVTASKLERLSSEERMKIAKVVELQPSPITLAALAHSDEQAKIAACGRWAVDSTALNSSGATIQNSKKDRWKANGPSQGRKRPKERA
jgi:hypothetical protein